MLLAHVTVDCIVDSHLVHGTGARQLVSISDKESSRSVSPGPEAGSLSVHSSATVGLSSLGPTGENPSGGLSLALQGHQLGNSLFHTLRIPRPTMISTKTTYHPHEHVSPARKQ